MLCKTVYLATSPCRLIPIVPILVYSRRSVSDPHPHQVPFCSISRPISVVSQGLGAIARGLYPPKSLLNQCFYMKSFGITGIFYLVGTCFLQSLFLQHLLTDSQAWLVASADAALPAPAAPRSAALPSLPLELSLLPTERSLTGTDPADSARVLAKIPLNASDEVPAVNRVRRLYVRLVPWVNSHSIYHDATVRLVAANQASADPETSTSALFQACLASDSTAASNLYETQAPYQVWVSDRLVAALPQQAQAEQLVRQIRQVLSDPNFDAASLFPHKEDDQWFILHGDQVLFAIDPTLTQTFRRDGDLIAIDWTNNLRTALAASPLSVVEAQRQMYNLDGTGRQLSATASWYGPYFHKRLTANGERFDQYSLTAAHKTLPFGSYLQVTNARNGESVIVRINDRGPYVGQRSLDLSYQAAHCIGSSEAGVVPYEAVMLQPEPETPVAATFSEAEIYELTARISDLRLRRSAEDLEPVGDLSASDTISEDDATQMEPETVLR